MPGSGKESAPEFYCKYVLMCGISCNISRALVKEVHMTLLIPKQHLIAIIIVVFSSILKFYYFIIDGAVGKLLISNWKKQCNVVKSTLIIKLKTLPNLGGDPQDNKENTHSKM
ncbi:hypothetical protein FF38_03413 [Lucilia cuprina]|uniref:Uncharacterized protein n=1 Tax=Lucilia cuprina TaxID=7375 RepID=A0A0L0C0X1_LUCCU|nr:hypothetical protein FF38_03413 [Lucilia cuprina]